MALPPGIVPKSVTVGIASFFDGSLAEGTATITAPVNVVHTPSNRPIFSSQMSHRFVDGETSFNLAPTDAPGLNRVDWTYKLNVVISGALVQPEPVYFTLPTAGPDEIDLDSLVTVPSSAGTPISATVVTSVNGQTGDVTVNVAPADGSVTPAKLSFDPATQAEFDALAAVARTGAYSDLTGKPTIPAAPGDATASTKGLVQLAGDLGGTSAAPTVPGLASKVNSSTYTAGLATKAAFDGPTVAQGRARVFDPRTATYNFRPDNTRRLRAAVAAVRAGSGLCDIAIYGDSRAQGSTTSPQTKSYERAWPGLLRKRLTGSAQGGLLPWWDIITEFDDRWSSTGTWTLNNAGPFDAAMRQTTDGTVSFVGEYDSIAIYTLHGSGNWTWAIDGGAATTVSGTANRIGATSWCRTVVPAGALGQHTITVARATTTLFFGGFEPMRGTTGFRVHSIARAGYDADRLLYTDGSGWRSREATWAWKAPHVGIIDLGINSFNNQAALTTFSGWTQQVIDKIKLSGTPVLVAPYDYPSSPAQAIPLSEYIKTYYDLADSNDIPLIDLNWWFKADTLWPSNPSGYMGDGIHFDNEGQAAHELIVARALDLTAVAV